MQIVFGADLTYFWWSCIGGILFAVAYDILRIKRRLIFTPNILVGIEDIAYSLGYGTAAVYIAYAKNNGSLRLYSLICIAAVFLLYRLIIGNRAVKAVAGAVLYIGDFLRRAVLTIFRPAVYGACKLKSAINGICKKIKDKFCGLRSVVLRLYRSRLKNIK